MPTHGDLRSTIRTKVMDLARELGRSPTPFSDDDTLLAMGILDSAGVLELLVWLEAQLDIELDPDELSLDNFGSVNLMASFLSARAAG